MPKTFMISPTGELMEWARETLFDPAGWVSSSEPFPTAGTVEPTGCLTPDITACLSRGRECSPYSPVTLATVLQADVHPRYSLSPKACAGILRRAAKRGRELPPTLKAALEATASLLLPNEIVTDDENATNEYPIQETVSPPLSEPAASAPSGSVTREDKIVLSSSEAATPPVAETPPPRSPRKRVRAKTSTPKTSSSKPRKKKSSPTSATEGTSDLLERSVPATED